MKIEINNRTWHIKKVSANDPVLADDEVTLCGLTSFVKSTIYINEDLNKDLMKDTIMHELAHAFIFVYGHPQYETYSEENVCDFFGAFGIELVELAYDIFEKFCV